MALENKNVRSVRLDHETECFVCDQMIIAGAFAVAILFKISLPWPLGTKEFEKYLHLVCGADLRDLLDERLKEAAKQVVTT